MSIRWPAPVVQAIARRRAVILIGSGVSANALTDDGKSPPTWGKFLNTAYSELGRRVPHIARALKYYQYLEACDFLKSEHNNGWADLIRNHFATPQYKAAEIHKAIFELDSRLVVSLNFDNIYEKYALRVSEGTVVVKNYYDAEVRQTVAGSDRYVLKPHGTVDSVTQMIFTLEDYARARITHSSFYEVLSALLHTHTFLCFGCGLSDPDMKLIFEDYRYKHGESPHFICLPSPISSQEIALIQKTRGLNVIKYSPKENHKELTQSIVELGKLVGERREEIANLQSW